jgi:hypothetical protein
VKTHHPTMWLAEFAVGLIAALSASAGADDTCRPSSPASQGAALKPEPSKPEALAARIDAAFEADWRAAGVTPAPLADDAEFMRRVYLDITGKIPAVAEARDFLEDTRSEKRRLLVENLLSRGSFAAHFANVWRELLLPGTTTNPETRALAPAFEAWLKVRFAANVPYDALASEILTARLTANATPPIVGRRTTLAPSPAAFYQVNENKPENLAANASRIFLGMQVQCAQCHNHPFSHWRRTEFWGLAAFFGGLQPMTDAVPNDVAAAVPVAATGPLTIKVPESDLVVEAKFLDGSAPQFRAGEDVRLTLSRWLTSRQNPYFAKAAVNRLLDLFYGHGFVEPVDDLDERHPPVHPDLFDEIAAQFAAHRFDLKFLVRTITATRAYQLSSQTDTDSARADLTTPELSNPELSNQIEHFARMPLKRMTPEQLYDSLLVATGLRDATVEQPQNPFSDDSRRGQFLARFADESARRSEAETSILQALSLMNGSLTADAASVDRGQFLSAVIDLPYLDPAGRIETLYLATLSRHPTSDESARTLDYLRHSSSEKDALTDIFWALLNSAEFIFNH